jgi:glycosyltransferase involved in cell wall biosynthesis
MVKIKFITPNGIIGASSRYRVYQYIEYLEKDGYACEVYPFLPDNVYKQFKKGKNIRVILAVPWLVIKRLQLLYKCKKNDILFIHRDIIPFGTMIIERLLKWKGCKIILDIDDAIYSNDISEISNRKNKLLYKFKYGKRFNTSIKLANIVICGNRFIDKYAQLYNRNTVIIPTVIDTNKVLYKPIKKDKDKFKICWIGNPGNTDYVINILPGIDKIAKDRNIKIILIGAKKIEQKFNNIEIKVYPWDIKTEYELIRKCDIGIMPLNDSEWSKGKCGLKLLQYMSVGIPVIASNIGVNEDIVKEGKNGFLVNSNKTEQWAKTILNVVDKKNDLGKMQQYCRNFIEEKYSVKVWSKTLEEVISSIYNGVY